MKRLLVGLIATIAMMALAPTALANYSICGSWYLDGELCWRHCDFYDNNGNMLGSITEDYQC